MKYYFQSPLSSILKTTQRRRVREQYQVCYFDGRIPAQKPTKICEVPAIVCANYPQYASTTANELLLFVKHHPDQLGPEDPAIIAPVSIRILGREVFVFVIAGPKGIRVGYLRCEEYIVPRSRVLLRKVVTP